MAAVKIFKFTFIFLHGLKRCVKKKEGGQPTRCCEVRVVRSANISEARACTNSNDKMAQIAMVSQIQRNSQRGVGTACQSRGGSHSQGCHWRKRLESCIEIERDKDRREGEEEWKDVEKRVQGVRHIKKDRGDGGAQDDETQGQVTGKKEKERLEI